MAYSELPAADILKAQICSECANYLSVGPIVVSKDGSVICGRCPKPSNAKESLYNIIAQKLTYACVNHRAGCEQKLQVNEAVAHEAACEFKKEYQCPLCYFEGNSCQLFYHFEKLHTNLLVKGGTLNGILSYHKLKNHVASILTMTERQLKLFVNSAVKLFYVCTRCMKQFSEEATVYICPEYHLLCGGCSTFRCKECRDLCEVNKKTELHDILLDCEWDGCDKQKNIFQYISHKQMCGKRLYKCPSEKCRYVGLLDDLKKHWHLSNIHNGRRISFSNDTLCFWYIDSGREVLHVFCENFGGNNVSITIDEKNVVSPFSFDLVNKHVNIRWSYKPLKHVRYLKDPLFFKERFLTAKAAITHF